jgi:hypothetical protein
MLLQAYIGTATAPEDVRSWSYPTRPSKDGIPIRPDASSVGHATTACSMLKGELSQLEVSTGRQHILWIGS